MLHLKDKTDKMFAIVRIRCLNSIRCLSIQKKKTFMLTSRDKGKDKNK